jgi:hypothetical protein
MSPKFSGLKIMRSKETARRNPKAEPCNARFLLGLHLDPDGGGIIFFRNVR